MKQSSASHPTNFRLASHVGSACAFCIVLLALSPCLAIAQNDTAPPIDPPSPSPIRIARATIP